MQHFSIMHTAYDKIRQHVSACRNLVPTMLAFYFKVSYLGRWKVKMVFICNMSFPPHPDEAQNGMNKLNKGDQYLKGHPGS